MDDEPYKVDQWFFDADKLSPPDLADSLKNKKLRPTAEAFVANVGRLLALQKFPELMMFEAELSDDNQLSPPH